MNLFASEKDRSMLLAILWELPINKCPSNKSCPYKRHKWDTLTSDQQEKLKRWYQELQPQVRYEIDQQLHHRKTCPTMKEKRQELKIHLCINYDVFHLIEDLQTELETLELDSSIRSHILFEFTNSSPVSLCYWRKSFRSQPFQEDHEHGFGLLLLRIETFYGMLFPEIQSKTIDYEHLKAQLFTYKRALSESTSIHVDDCRLSMGFVDLRKELIDIKKKVILWIGI